MSDQPRWTEYMKLSDIVPADRNPKRHDDEGIDASLTEFGYGDAAVMDERTMKLVGGHGRTEALAGQKERGVDPPDGVVRDPEGEWLVPVQRGWASRDDRHAEAFGIALNRYTERGGWDVAELISMLDDMDPDEMLKVGFSQDEIDDLVAQAQEETLAFNTEEGHDVTQGAQAEPDIGDRAQRYAGKGVRSVVLDYTLNEFDVITANLARLRRHYALENSAAVVMKLVEAATAALPTEPADEAAAVGGD